jgi:hypothetical protein
MVSKGVKEMTEFNGFRKIARFSRDCVVTEKIDGTNAQIYIGEDDEFLTGSRKRWITPENDNYGFARWAQERKDELIAGLGPGRHFGEWWGCGIQRRYGLKEKRFSLFDVERWGEERPECCHCVPVLWTGCFDSVPVDEIMSDLSNTSMAAPGYDNPEGIVIYYKAGNVYFKKTFEKDALEE